MYDNRPELQPLLEALEGYPHANYWLTHPTSYLSGEIPEKVAITNPARALRAAQRFAASFGK
jgi:hypothetical protein